MKGKTKQEKPELKVSVKVKTNSLIKKLSEVQAMSNSEKLKFRESGGTSIQG